MASTITLKFLTLPDIKDQLRIESDFALEDNKLLKFGKAAEETTMNYLNRGDTIDEAIASLTEQYGEIPESVIEAALELVDHQYQYRGLVSPTSISTVPYNWDLLLKPYMKL